MANLNKVFLMGNLTRDPELRYTPSGSPVCEFGLAINRSYKTAAGEQRDEVCFVDIVMWGRRGVVISEYFTKGKPIFIEGRLQYDSWETAEGRRSRLRVVADNFEFLGGGRGPAGDAGGVVPDGGEEAPPPARPPRQDRGQPRSAGPAKPPQKPDKPEEETYDVGEDEIPF
jgi:single-strand DNA-binding protein